MSGKEAAASSKPSSSGMAAPAPPSFSEAAPSDPDPDPDPGSPWRYHQSIYDEACLNGIAAAKRLAKSRNHDELEDLAKERSKAISMKIGLQHRGESGMENAVDSAVKRGANAGGSQS
jgi:hypothetical protein